MATYNPLDRFLAQNPGIQQSYTPITQPAPQPVTPWAQRMLDPNGIGPSQSPPQPVTPWAQRMLNPEGIGPSQAPPQPVTPWAQRMLNPAGIGPSQAPPQPVTPWAQRMLNPEGIGPSQAPQGIAPGEWGREPSQGGQGGINQYSYGPRYNMLPWQQPDWQNRGPLQPTFERYQQPYGYRPSAVGKGGLRTAFAGQDGAQQQNMSELQRALSGLMRQNFPQPPAAGKGGKGGQATPPDQMNKLLSIPKGG